MQSLILRAKNVPDLKWAPPTLRNREGWSLQWSIYLCHTIDTSNEASWNRGKTNREIWSKSEKEHWSFHFTWHGPAMWPWRTQAPVFPSAVLRISCGLVSCVLLKPQIKFQHAVNKQHMPVLYHFQSSGKAMSSERASTVGILSSLLSRRASTMVSSCWLHSSPVHTAVLLRLRAVLSSCRPWHQRIWKDCVKLW